MKLSLPLLLRLRRKIRRQLHPFPMMTGISHPYAACAGRCDTDEPPPPKNMKKLILLMLFVLGLAFAVGALNSCTGTFTKDGVEYDYSITPKVKEQKSLEGNRTPNAERPTPNQQPIEEAEDWPGTPNPLDPPWDDGWQQWTLPQYRHFGPHGSVSHRAR